MNSSLYLITARCMQLKNVSRASIILNQPLSVQYSTDIIDPPGSEPYIPNYAHKPNENIQNQRARLLYQSRKRGILENDLILSTFAAKYLNTMTEERLKQYDNLINNARNDWDIYYWATGAKPVPEEFNSEVMNLLKEHVQNKNKEARFRQPDIP